MPQEYLSSPDVKAPLLLNSSAGAAGQSVVSMGAGNIPAYQHRVKFTNSTIEPLTPVEGDEWFNPDWGVKVTWVVDANSSQWVELSATGGGSGGGFPAGNITSDGAIGSTANLPIVTTTSGVLTTGAFGTGAGQFIEGNAASNTDSREWTAPTITLAEYELGTSTDRRAYTPALWRDAAAFEINRQLQFDPLARFGGIATGSEPRVGSFGLTTGGVLRRAVRTELAGSSLATNFHIFDHIEITSAIAGDKTFTLHATHLASLLASAVTYIWTGTLRFTYTSGTLTFFSGATGYTTSWDEGSQPTFVAGQDYLIGIAVSGGAGTIRLSLLNKTVASTLIGGYTSAGMTMATARILGRSTAATGAAEEISIGSGLSLSGGTLTATGGGVSDGDKGDITVSASGATWTVDNGAITLAKQSDVATSTVFYRKTAGAGAPEVQTLATLKADLDLTGTNTGDQTITLTGDVTGTGNGSFATTVANDVITYAKLQNVTATDRLLGRSTAGAGDVEEITCTAAGRNLIDDADATAQRTTLGLGTLATQSGTFSGTSSGTNTGDQTITKSLSILSPTATENVVLFRTPAALTFTSIISTVKGTTPSATFSIRYGTDISAAGTLVVTAGITTTNSTTGLNTTAFDNAAVPADNFVWLTTSAISGTVDQLSVSLIF